MIAEHINVTWTCILLFGLIVVIVVLTTRVIALEDDLDHIRTITSEDNVKSIVIDIFDDLHDYRQRNSTLKASLHNVVED